MKSNAPGIPRIHRLVRRSISLGRLVSTNIGNRLFASRFSQRSFRLLSSLSFLLRPFDRPTSGSSICSSWFEFFPADQTTNQPFGIRSEILKVASAFPLPRFTITLLPLLCAHFSQGSVSHRSVPTDELSAARHRVDELSACNL